MTGHCCHACDILPGDIIHREPHHCGGRTVGHEELDVEVVRREIEGPYIALRWRPSAGYLGAQSTVTGITVYELGTPVLVIGHAA